MSLQEEGTFSETRIRLSFVTRTSSSSFSIALVILGRPSTDTPSHEIPFVAGIYFCGSFFCSPLCFLRFVAFDYVVTASEFRRCRIGNLADWRRRHLSRRGAGRLMRVIVRLFFFFFVQTPNVVLLRSFVRSYTRPRTPQAVPVGQLELLCRQACMHQARELQQRNPQAVFARYV